MMTTLVLLAVMTFPTPICIVDAQGNVTSDLSPFIDAANHDFRLRPNACAINAGATLPSVKKDFLEVDRPQGSGYDIGAYELVEGLAAPKGLTIK